MNAVAPEGSTLSEEYRKTQESRRNEFLRDAPENDEQIRKFVISTFVDAIQNIPKNCPLRFHGGHIYDLETILKSGELSSGADRIGAQTSFDLPGEISVTNAKTVHVTIGDLTKARELQMQGREIRSTGYIDLLDTKVPVGFIAVLVPESPEEANMGENGRNKMNTSRLDSQKCLCLVVSSEIKDKVVAMADTNRLPNLLILSYEEFVQAQDAIVASALQRNEYMKTYQAPADSDNIAIEV